MATEPEPVLQRCRTANCTNRQDGQFCADHGGVVAEEPTSKKAAAPTTVAASGEETKS